ncbi:MAG TPA: hypothetical protein VG756_04920 [Pseudonocardiaceae bacterium]|jgi:hypothetical protein|nr:hypothetical protein [Pseudonocardiaceae bacterium]
MDIRTIDQNYDQLQRQSQQTVNSISALAGKLQAAAAAGNTDAREWLLDLKEVTLGFQQEQNQVTLLLQAIHNYVSEQEQRQQQQPQQPQYQQQQPMYQQPGYGDPYYQQQGGGFSRFMHSGFGQAITTGAGFAIGEDIINDIF